MQRTYTTHRILPHRISAGRRSGRLAATLGAGGGGVLLLIGATLGVSCDSSGGGAAIGSACTEADHTVDRELCSGTNVIECELDAASQAYLWQVKKNCADTGRVCVSGDCHSGGGAAIGSACTEADHTVDRELCSGSNVIECKLDAASQAYLWQVKKDCADTDRVCVSGDCQAPTSECITVAGVWSVTQHCVASEVGHTYTVTQVGCAFAVTEADWEGHVDAQGGLSMTGPAGPGVTMTCSGSVTASALAVDCTPACHVEMTR